MPSVEPWAKTLNAIRTRCGNKKSPNYERYGGRGIKCLITKEELKFLWFRDKASKLKRHSIDRINNDGNYELKNCRYIELRENTLRNNSPVSINARKTHCPKGHPLSGSNVVIRKKMRNCRECIKGYQRKWKQKNINIVRKKDREYRREIYKRRNLQ